MADETIGSGDAVVVEGGQLDESTAEQWSVRRILVALDASVHSQAAMNAAVALATRLHSEIHGLFVEDINLFRLAELPFAREIRYGEPVARQVEREELQRKLRARAAVLRHELEALTEQNKLRSTFRVVRGAVDSELLAAALDSDLLALGRSGHSFARRARLGSAARTAVSRAASAVLLVRPEVEGGMVVALYEGSAAGRRALMTAAGVVGQGEEAGALRVLVWGPDEQTAFDRRQLVARLLEPTGTRPQIQHSCDEDPARILEWVNKQHGSLLILAGDGLPPGVVDRLLDDAEQHLLLVR